MDLKSFPKYQNLDNTLLNEIRNDLLTKYSNPKLLDQKFKSLIHQIWGSYYTSRPNFTKLIEKIKSSENPREYISTLLQIHSSTKERSLFYSDFYTNIFAITGLPKSILDMGCGFNPLSFVLDQRFKDMVIDCIDIDNEEITFLNQVFDTFGLNTLHADLGSVLNFDFNREYDVVLLLKLLPVIDQQRRGSVLNILKKVKANHLVISFPTKSIGGKSKGMETNYRDYFMNVVKELNFDLQEILFDNELVFVCSSRSK